VGARTGLEAVKKRKMLHVPGIETGPSSPQPVAVPTIWIMQILSHAAFTSSCKQNILFCDTELMVKFVVITNAGFVFVTVNLSNHSKRTETRTSYTVWILAESISPRARDILICRQGALLQISSTTADREKYVEKL
jgi:hypothetical protein